MAEIGYTFSMMEESEQERRLAEGDPAPGFALSDHEGRTVRLEDHRGSWVVLWWYPIASSPG